MEGEWARVLHPAHLTGAGRPQLQHNEIECQLVDAVEMQLESAPNTPSLRGGVVTLTTHRIIWLHQLSNSAAAIPHAAVCKIFPPKKSIRSMFVNPKVRIQLWSTNGNIALGAEDASDASINLALVFRGQSSPESFIARLGEVIEAKAWAKTRIRSQSPVAAEGSSMSGGYARQHPVTRKMNPAMAGVSGILRKEKVQWEEIDKNLHAAFQDLNTLMVAPLQIEI